VGLYMMSNLKIGPDLGLNLLPFEPILYKIFEQVFMVISKLVHKNT